MTRTGFLPALLLPVALLQNVNMKLTKKWTLRLPPLWATS